MSPAAEHADDLDPRFEDHARRYLDHSRRQHTASTHRTRQSLVDARLLPFFRGWRLSEIQVRDVEALLARHGALSPATRNRILGALSALLTYAVRMGCLERNVAASIPRAPEDAKALPLISVAQQQTLLEAIPGEKRLLFLAALDTGARLGELLALRWSDVDWDVGALRVRRSKSRRPRIVRAATRLMRALRAARDVSGEATGRIFADAIGSDGGLRWAWRTSLRRAARLIGHPDLRVHDLRHLAAINLVRAGLDLPTVQAHLGHRHLVSTLRYAAYADETASARAARTLDRLHGEEAGSPDAPGSRG